MSHADPNRPTPNTVIRLRREQRHRRLQTLGYKDYPTYLRSTHWAQTRAQYRASSTRPQDCICGATEHLQLHHMTYERIGCEMLEDLTPLCADCHAMIHVLERRGEIGLDFTGFVNEQRAARRRSEVEAAEYERLMSWLEDRAFIEDLRRRVEAMRKMPGAKDQGHFLHRVLSSFKQIERKLDAVQSKFV